MCILLVAKNTKEEKFKEIVLPLETVPRIHHHDKNPQIELLEFDEKLECYKLKKTVVAVLLNF